MKYLKHIHGRAFFRDAALPLEVRIPNYQLPVDAWHCHEDFCELVVVCSGSACLETRVSSEQLHSGNIYLFPVQSIHCYTGIKNFRHYNILFDLSLLNSGPEKLDLKTLPGYKNLFTFQHSGQDRYSKLNSVDEQTLARLVSILETIRNEITMALPGWRENAYFEFMRMMVLLLRTCVPLASAAGENIFPIGRAIRMMEKDCSRNYTLEELAKAVNMSPSCFRHNFTKITGIPPGEYLMNLRLRKALLLLSLSESVTSISQQAGFSDSNYFARFIRKRTGFSPKELQRKYNAKEISTDEMLAKIAGHTPIPAILPDQKK